MLSCNEIAAEIAAYYSMYSKYVTVQDVAELLHLHQRTITGYIKQGKLNADRVGRKYLIPEAEVERFLEQRPKSVPRPREFFPGATEEHYRELMAFGRRLRDRLFIPGPQVAFKRRPMWRGEDREALNTSESERNRALAWGAQDRDQRGHPLYHSFQSHLDDNACWAVLGDIQFMLEKYEGSTADVDRFVKTTAEQCWPNGDPDEVEEASEVVLPFVLRYALWLPRKEAADRKAEAVRLRQSMSVLAETYPRILRILRLSQETGRFHASITRDYPRELEPLVQSVLDMRHMAPSLIGWRGAVISLSELTIGWRKSLGPDHILRKAIVKGRCEWCP